MAMTALSVNLNKIALIRNSRETDIPDLCAIAKTIINAGAQGITIHPRPDQRHIRATDAHALAIFLKNYPTIEFNIEGNPFAGSRDLTSKRPYPGFLELVSAVRPHQCTLVPDDDQQLTSDHGWDLDKDGERLRPIIRQLTDWGIRVSLFMDAGTTQLSLVKAIGAERIEIYTGPYADAFATEQESEAVARIQATIAEAKTLGLGINAGHDLNLHNLTKLISLGDIDEVSIGHALTVDALYHGMETTIKAYLSCLGQYVTKA